MEKIADGIYKMTFGKPENKTPVSILRNHIRHDEPEGLSEEEIPSVCKEISHKQTQRGCILEIPMKNNEQVFGLGL